jgi:hypothetical protein
MIKPLFLLKKLGLPLVLAGLLLLLLAGTALSATVELLNDGFERPVEILFELWDGNGITDWSYNPSIRHSGLRAARATNNNEGYLTSDSLNTSDANSIVVDFWFYKDKTSDTGFTLYYFNGTAYNLIAELDSLGADNVWLHYTQTITDAQYFTSDFRLRFEATLGPSESVEVDDVLITKETGELPTLTVSKSGTGSGTVTSSPAGIDCGSDCSESYNYNTVVTLSAAAATGSTFTGWSGSGCSGTGTCVVTMDAAKSVTATFILNTYTLNVSKSGTGSGTVTSSPAGIDCGLDCSESYNYNTVVTLSAAAVAGSTFTGWSGSGCSGTGTCVVTMDAAKSVTATFTQDEYTLTVNVVGYGTVAKDPDQLIYHYGNIVQLTATPAKGWALVSWSGDLTGADNPDTILMDGDKTVTATFTQVTYYLYLPQFYK